jgi:hypothetical protein
MNENYDRMDFGHEFSYIRHEATLLCISQNSKGGAGLLRKLAWIFPRQK